jgi:hypothetical protein
LLIGGEICEEHQQTEFERTSTHPTPIGIIMHRMPERPSFSQKTRTPSTTPMCNASNAIAGWMVISFAALHHCNIVIELDFEGEFQFHEMLQIDPVS